MTHLQKQCWVQFKNDFIPQDSVTGSIVNGKENHVERRRLREAIMNTAFVRYTLTVNEI